jgi:RNA polymerase sigma-70 factor (ECF subfamily)
MAPGVVETRLAKAQQNPDAPPVQKELSSGEETRREKSQRPLSPRIVRTTPRPGETGVDPELAEITVTFDRDMGPEMSWTGGPPLFPPVDQDRKARWPDARTCVLPVKLEAASYYRLGINSSGKQNFRSDDGVPAPPSVIYFSTVGASEEVYSRVRMPTVVAIDPKNGAMDVDPSIKELRVTFSVPACRGREAGLLFQRREEQSRGSGRMTA